MIENRIERAGQLLYDLFDVSGIDVEWRREQHVITFIKKPTRSNSGNNPESVRV
jgi:hypothetical protein